MNLISCENCGNVLNKDRIKIPDKIYDLLNTIYDERIEKEVIKYWVWNRNENEWGLYITCPACKTKIFLDTGDKVC